MIERHRLGGDCTWTGCVPSKALLKAAKVAHTVAHATGYGVNATLEGIDFQAVIGRVHRLREEIYEDADRPEIYTDMGVETVFGEARLVDDHTIEIKEDNRSRRVSARYIIIASGGRASVPPITGLGDVAYLTNETLFEITKLPRQLAIIGAGPIGSEMAQAFRRLGSHVTVLDRANRILARDDAELAAMLQERLGMEGVRYLLEADIRRIENAGKGIRIEAGVNGENRIVEADALLVATGRKPNIEDLGLDAAGIDYGARGITVNDQCRTNVRHIFAVGDVTGRYQFTHMSEHMAKVAVTNALAKWPLKIDVRNVPWATYTDPELAHVGAGQAELEAQGERFTTFRFPFSKIDRAVTDGETTGLIKVFARKRSGKILGADILGTGAGDLIGEYAVAMRRGITMRQISDTIHPYPTYGLGLRRAADQWYIQNHSPFLIRLLKSVMRYRGTVNHYEPGRIV